MGKNKVLVKVHPEGKYVVDIDKGVDRALITAGMRVALRNDSYALHLLLPTKVDPLVSLMKVEKVPDSTYDMVGGLDRQIKVLHRVFLFLFGVGERRRGRRTRNRRGKKTGKLKKKGGAAPPPLSLSLTSHDEPVPALVPRPRRSVRLVVSL